MPSELLLAGSVYVGDHCLWPKHDHTAVIEARAIGGIWETEATIDHRSYALHWLITLNCIKVEGIACPEEAKLYVSELRKSVGEGPFVGVYTGQIKTVNYTNLYWRGPPRISDDLKRYEEFNLELITVDDPVITDTP